ncbi:MAG: Mrp/NBP35 family ATP-binding protein [Propionibacteriaceae bacterium]|nr:Mrp/NBP35 family ATP-binding protein [Propionibacteriaceae bacterium]
MAELENAIYEALSTVIDPEIRRPITDLDMVESVIIDPDSLVTVSLLLTVAGCPMQHAIQRDIVAAVSQVAGVNGVEVNIGAMNDEQRAALRRKLRPDEKEIPFTKPDSPTRVFLVASGKGGVGKSSVTLNLAIALAAKGKRVGLLDADIYGHSIPQMLGVSDSVPTTVDGMIMPVATRGISVISIGMMKNSPDQVIAWRGPILDRALQQFLADVYWGELDFLLIDLPPGTGDVALSLGHKLPNAEVIVVTTPQQAAADVAERAGTMAAMLEQKVIGVVENMSFFDTDCPHCGQSHRVELFGAGGGTTVAAALSARLEYEVPLLAEIPFTPIVAQAGDRGIPVVSLDASEPVSQSFAGLADRLVAR